MTIDRSMVAGTEYEEFEQREREHGAGRRGEHAGEIRVDAELVHGLEYQHAEQVHDDITKRGVDSPRDHEAHRLLQHLLKHNSRAASKMKRTVATTLVLALPLSA